MKRSILQAMFGVAATAALTSAHGQGSITFANYYVNTQSALVTPANVTYAAGTYTDGGQAGWGVGSSFNADLLFSLDHGTTWTDTGAITPFLGTAGPLSDQGTSFCGLFTPTTVTGIGSGASVGPVYFQVEAFNAATWSQATIRGVSSTIILTSISTGATPVTTMMNDNPLATTPFVSFTVAAVPEPGTLALAGLGGFGMLMALRRKNT